MLDKISKDALIWIYGFSRDLNAREREVVRKSIQQFVQNWNSHKIPVKGDFELLYDRFVVLAAESSPSGCSIDSSITVFKKLEHQLGIDALDQNLVFYANDNSIQSCERDRFRELVKSGQISETTKVFDLTLTTVGDLQTGKFEKDFRDSWHWLVFKQN